MDSTNGSCPSSPLRETKEETYVICAAYICLYVHVHVSLSEP